LTLPLMVAIQLVSARIGYVTRRGLAANIKRAFPPAVLWMVVGLLVTANILNLAADIAAMAQALHLVVGGPRGAYAVGFGALCLALQVFMRYHAYVRWLKWLTLALLAYVAVAFTVELDWRELAWQLALPGWAVGHDALVMIVAVFGTTISPYLFFWQAALEMESGRDGRPRARGEVRRQLRRIRADTLVGMTFSNLIGFFIILATAATLHAGGGVRIETSAQAAEALRPVAGDLCFLLFCLGIVGTGLLAVPVLAGSAAYAVAEAAGLPASLDARLERGEGHAFYAVIAAATAGGVALCFAPVDPVEELFWVAVLNGVVALPIMAVMMLLASRRAVMGAHVIGPRLRLAGWCATVAMGFVVAAMLLTV
ncbi:NRAMP family divalent metal transporter, partial [Achromobacter xylosoxidans]